ncbi:MAG: hypothetical protein ACJ72J_10725 [Nitrososphaeraceae archaeon]
MINLSWYPSPCSDNLSNRTSLQAFKTSIQSTRDNLKEFSRIGVNAARTYEQTSRDTTTRSTAGFSSS